ncbi:MAG: TRAP transporter large permease subunit [Bacillota bacterium]|nr:TRAP transporter large permease subunit [Bacillota bacterium]
MLVAVFCVLFLLLGIPIAMVVLLGATAGILIYSDTSIQIVIQHLFSGMNNYVLLAIPFFIMAGSLAAKGSTSKYLIQVMRIVFGRLPGGSMVGAVLACAFFAAISGSSIATIIAIGTIVIPAALEEGYPERLPVGVITSGGSLGILIPPSAPMIGLCVAMGVSVSSQFIAGIVPGLILAFAWCGYAMFASRNLPLRTYQDIKRQDIPRIFIKAIPALLFPLIVLGGIYSGIFTPTEAAAVSVAYVVLIELFVYRTTNLRTLFNTLYESLVTSATMTFIISCGAVLTWFVTTQQIPALLNNFITASISSQTSLLLILLALFFIVGCFMDLFAMIIILGPILLPTLLAFNINLIQFGIICIMATQIAFLTPPFGLNLFVSMRVSKQGLWETARATMPYTIILMIVTLVVTFIPQISLWLPGLMK